MGTFLHFKLWLISLFIIGPLLVIFSSNFTGRQIQADYTMVQDLLGSEVYKKIKNRSDKAYLYCCGDTATWFESNYLNDMQGKDFVSETLTAGFRNVWAGIYQLIVRMNIFIQSFILFAPFWIAFIIDGLAIRKAKTANLGWFSPVKFHSSTHLMMVLIGLFILYLFLPFSVHLFFLFSWFIIIGFALNIFSRNVQRTI